MLPGEIVMNRMRASSGLFAAATSDGLVSPDYAIFRTVSQVNVAYAVQLFRTPAMMAVFRIESTGLGTGESGFLRLYSDQFGRLAIPIPPLAEQAAIMRFLDWATGRLDRTIRAKRKVIALLTEQKQAINQRAVTCGIDEMVARKPTGIAHLGEVPQSWEVRRLKSLVTNVIDQTATKNADEIYIALEHVQSWTGRVNLQRSQDEDLFTGKVKKFRKNDVLFGKLRPYLAKVITAPSSGVCVGEFFVLRTDQSLITSLFLERLLRSVSVIRTINSSTFGAKMPRADWQFVGNLLVALPAIREQAMIVESILRETTPLDNAVSRREHEIELLREYRARLVADVVTGQLDVREAAARLPVVTTPVVTDDLSAETDEAELADEETAA